MSVVLPVMVLPDTATLVLPLVSDMPVVALNAMPVATSITELSVTAMAFDRR